MTVSYIVLGKHDGATRVKCFFEDGAAYGEFYLWIDEKRGLIRFAAKEATYRKVLTDAFQQAMQG